MLLCSSLAKILRQEIGYRVPGRPVFGAPVFI